MIRLLKIKNTINLIKLTNSVYSSSLVGMDRFTYFSRVMNELLTLNSIRFYSKEIKYFLDVGANTGMTSIAAFYLFGKSTEIYMYEPSIDCEPILQKIERKISRIKFFSFALGKETKKLPFNRSLSSKTSQASSFYKPTEFYKSQEKHASSQAITSLVDVQRLDSIKDLFDKSKKPEIFLHLDVEGYEANVIDGATNILNNIAIISLEYSPRLFDKSYTLSDINDSLEKTHTFLCSLGKPMLSSKGEVLVQDLVWIHNSIFNSHD